MGAKMFTIGGGGALGRAWFWNSGAIYTGDAAFCGGAAFCVVPGVPKMLSLPDQVPL